MKNVLAFGDSLTWGADATNVKRHAFEDRWPNALEASLDGQCRVFAEGLSGRNTAFDDYSNSTERNGVKALPSILATHEPLDLVIIMLGTNDMRKHICGNAAGSAAGIAQLIRIVRNFNYQPDHKVPKILVVSPPHVLNGTDPHFDGVMDGAIELSHQYFNQYKLVCDRDNVSLFNAATVCEPDPIDGVHLDAINTKILGVALAPIVEDILSLN